MTAQRWQQVKAIFDSAIALNPDARVEFVRDNCGTDHELLKEVLSLVSSDVEADSFLENPVFKAGAMAALAPVPGTPVVDPMVGRRIGNYIITSELARGGMGIVYSARHVSLPREVVVKCIRPVAFSPEGAEDLRARFRREAHIQAQLDHPHIVRVYEFFDGAEEYFLVMEYVHGSSLRSLLDERTILPAKEACALAAQALEGLACAHTLAFVDESGNTGTGIIHRDIKPANMLLDEHGNLKLTDFGIAKIPGNDRLTKTGFGPGTAEYMSPEQIQGLPADARSDLYSLGVVLYEMLTGRLPFSRTSTGSDYGVLKAQIETEPTPILTLNAGIPPSLADIVARSLKKDPNQRWQTAVEFRAALVPHQGNRAGTTASPSARPSTQDGFALRVKHYLQRRRLVMAGLGALALAAAVTGLFWLERAGASASFQPAQEKASIAVLRFVDLSAEKNQEYFSDGLAEELLNSLANTPGLRVAGRTSSFQFNGQTGDFHVIGKKLHVAAILEGSVRRQGNRAKITVDLINAADGYHLWSNTFDRDTNDIFAVQEEIASAVRGELEVALLKVRNAPSVRRTNAEAYNAYLQGQYFLERHTTANLEKAVGYFEQAIKLDRGYAPAWVGLGESRIGQASAGDVPPDEGFRKARAEVEAALALDADSGEAHSAIGQINMLHDRQWTVADASFRRALALEPGNARTIGFAGMLATDLGRLDEAIALYRRAMEIDPLRPRGYYDFAMALFYAGRQEEAATVLKKALDLFPEMENAHCLLGQIYLTQSHPQEALAEMEKEKDPALRLYGLALAYYALGRKQESEANMADLIARYHATAAYQIAEVYVVRGETDRAFEWLERAYAEHDTGLTRIKGDPLLKSLERDPRYAALLRKMRLPA